MYLYVSNTLWLCESNSDFITDIYESSTHLPDAVASLSHFFHWQSIFVVLRFGNCRRCVEYNKFIKHNGWATSPCGCRGAQQAWTGWILEARQKQCVNGMMNISRKLDMECETNVQVSRWCGKCAFVWRETPENCKIVEENRRVKTKAFTISTYLDYGIYIYKNHSRFQNHCQRQKQQPKRRLSNCLRFFVKAFSAFRP